jgi:hypothetical protein
MRLPFKDSNNGNIHEINSIFNSVGKSLMRSISPGIVMNDVNVMLADGTVVQSSTFETEKVTRFLRSLIRSLPQWQTSGLLESKTEDLNRLYCEVWKSVGKYYVKGYFGIQYHSLPYYQADRKVFEIQRSLKLLEIESLQHYSNLSREGNRVIEDELSFRGLGDRSNEDLLNYLLENEELYGELVEKVESVERGFPQYLEIEHQRKFLVRELEKFVIELYQVSPVLINYDKLMQGESGVVMYFDVGTIKNVKLGITDSYVDCRRLSTDIAEQMANAFREVQEATERYEP